MSKQRCLEILEDEAKMAYDSAADDALNAITGPKDQRAASEQSARDSKKISDTFRKAYDIVSANI